MIAWVAKAGPASVCALCVAVGAKFVGAGVLGEGMLLKVKSRVGSVMFGATFELLQPVINTIKIRSQKFF